MSSGKKYLNTEEVMKALLNGEKVRCTNYPKNCYLFLNSFGKLFCNDSGIYPIIDPNCKYEIYKSDRKYMNFIAAVKKMGEGYNLTIDEEDFEGNQYYIEDDKIVTKCGNRKFEHISYFEVTTNRWYVVDERN